MAMQWPSGVQMTFPSAEDRAITVANNAAQQAYNRARLNLETEQMALSKAQQAWLEKYQTAQLTGFFEGQPTMATNQFWAQTFGNYEQPRAGQATTDLEQQRWQQAAGLASAFGTWYRPGTQPVPGQTTLAQQQQAFAQGLASTQEARAAQNQLQEQAMAYLNLLSSLRGPADWAKYQQVLGATPGGMRDLVAAAMGQYLPGGGATTGMQPTPVSLQTMYQDVSGQPWTGQTWAGQPGMQPGVPGFDWAARVPTVSSATPVQQIAGPGGLTPEQISRIQQVAQARWMDPNMNLGGKGWSQWLFEDLINKGTPVERAIALASGGSDDRTVQEVINASGINATVQGGQTPQPIGGPNSPWATSLNPWYVPPPGTPQQQQQQSGLNPYYFSTGGAVGQPGALAAGPQGGTQPTQGFPAPQTIGALPLPNQIAPQTWANLAPSQQQLLLGAYESQGWHPQDVLALFNQSLPRYATNAPTAGTYRLQG